MKRLFIPVLSLALLLSTACGKETLTVPTQYDGSSFALHAAPQMNILAQMTTLDNLMKTGRIVGSVVDFPDLQFDYVQGPVNLSVLTAPLFNDLIYNPNNGYFVQLANSSSGLYDPNLPGTSGGVYGGYLFNAQGLEPGELINKGLYGALLYYQAAQLLDSDMSAAELDQVLALYGGHPDFANSDNATLHAHPDRFMAKYTARRDKNDGTGLYTGIRDNFLTLQAALVQGNDFAAERDAAIAALRLDWEKANAATVINYLHQATAKLTLTSPTEADFGSALHALGEAYGFLLGWYYLPTEYRQITVAQAEEILATLHFPIPGTPEPGLFVQNPAGETARLLTAIDQIQAVYGFTEAEITDFQKNWVSEQSR